LNYYPFGMMMPERQYSTITAYRFGYNGKENDDEVKGTGNQQDYGMRIYDPRLGRFLSVDPLSKQYPWYTPYQFAGNNPILSIDIDGLEPDKKVNKTETVTQTQTVTDAGHGINSDAGAQAKDKSAGEANLALKVETETAKSLATMGVTNTRTRTEESMTVTENQVNYRYKKALEVGASVLVSHHFNVGTNDILLLYHPTETKENTDNSSEEYQTNSLKLAEYLKTELEKVYTDRKVLIVAATKPDINYNTLGLLRGFDASDHAGILIELGDLNTPSTPEMVNTNAAAIGNAIATGMYRYLHNGENPPAAAPSNPASTQAKPAFTIPTLKIPTIKPAIDKTYVKPPLRIF
jgi:RHS repeat-associated protein